MSRSRASAKAAGSRFERLVADYLAEHVSEFVDRRVKTGSADKGDVGGVRAHGQRVTVECKDYGGRIQAGPWIKEAEIEAANDGAPVGIVVVKRRGTTEPGEQFVMMKLSDFAFLITGNAPQNGKIKAAPEVLETLAEA